MARTEVITVGGLLLLVAIIAYYFPIPFTLAGETVSNTIPNVVAFCESGIGQFAQLSPEIVKICSEFNTFMLGIYGSGLLGIILIIVGAAVPSSNQRVVEVYHETPQETRKEWNCEHCDFKSEEEMDLIEHYKKQHADEKGDSFHRKFAKKPLSPETLEILKRRYAQGEITKEEFEQMKKDLENS